MDHWLGDPLDSDSIMHGWVPLHYYIVLYSPKIHVETGVRGRAPTGQLPLLCRQLAGDGYQADSLLVKGISQITCIVIT